MECLMTYSPQGVPLGLRPRDEVHTLGLWHRVIHIWLASQREGEWGLWFQQRSMLKQEFPGRFELAVTGHIDGGETPLVAALREAQEEIGLCLSPHQLDYLGEMWEDARWNQRLDREIATVYLCRLEQPEFQPNEEVQRMVWVSLAQLCHWEGEGEQSTLALEEDGTPYTIPSDGWCDHRTSFTQLVHPELEEHYGIHSR